MSKKPELSDVQDFGVKVNSIITKHLEPLSSNVDYSQTEDVLALCVAYLNSAFQLMYELGYPKEEVEKRVLMTLDLVWLTSHLAAEHKKALH